MAYIITIGLLLAGIWVLANLQIPYPALPILAGLLLAGFVIHGGFNWWLLLPALPIGLLFVLFGYASFRKRFITWPLLRQFHKVLPPMSETEQEALDAGTVWWDGELFSGQPDWEKLLTFPAPVFSEEEHDFIDGPVDQLCSMLNDWQITHEDKDLPLEVWQFIADNSFFGMIIPKKYGGLEFSALAHSQVVMKLASRSVTAAVTVMVPNSLGPAKLLLHYGTEQQRQYYLPRLARGEEIPCFALTGPEAGSDAGAMPDVGVVCYAEHDNQQTLGIKLNWNKRYITLGPVATVIGLAFKLEDPDRLLEDGQSTGITVALIPTDTPGVSIGKRHIPLDIPFQNGPNTGTDVFIPIDWVIGGMDGIGQGWRMLVESLAEGRGISLPALATGAGKTACRYTGAYARLRRQFNTPIGHFEGVEEALARIAGVTYQMDAARTLTLSAIDAGEKPSVISAILKYHLTERYRQVINDAMDIQGGSGICLGPNNIIGRAYQAIPIAITVEGANILTRSMIIFGQGAIRCHPFILEEIKAAQEKEPRRALNQFDDALFRHVGFLLKNAARSFLLGLVRGHFTGISIHSPTKHYFERLNWMSAAFALCADVAMMSLGGALKRKERLSARLGDILSELYLSSAVLKQFEDQGHPESDLALLRWSCENSLYEIQEAFRSLFRNLPYPPLGWILRLIVFPTGMPFSVPSDKLCHDTAGTILSKSDARFRLTEGVYVSRNPEDRMGLLEIALDQAEQVLNIEGNIKGAKRSGLIFGDNLTEQLESAVAQGIITAAEKAEIEKMEQLRHQVIQVDAFEDYGLGPQDQTSSNDMDAA